MNEPSTDDRLIGQLAATLREPPDDELARGLGVAIDPVLREQLFELMETSRASAPMTNPAPAANAAGRRWWVIGLGLAAAAAVALVIVGQSEPEGVPRLAIAPFPDYGFKTDDGLALERNHTKSLVGELQYRSNNQFTWTGSPPTSFDGPMNVRMCASSASGEVVEIDVHPFLEIAPESGAIKLQGRVAALGLSPGQWTVTIAVGHPQVVAELGSVCETSKAEGMDVDRIELRLLED